MNVPSVYLAMADAETFVPRESARMGLIDPRAASLRCFQRYSRDPHRDLIDGDGMVRWVSVKQARVQSIVDRMAMSEGSATMAQIAAEALCNKATVSRTIQRLMSWGMYAIEVRRGRNGGVKVHRKGWERFWDLVYDARHRLKIARDRARLNVASLFRRRREGLETAPLPSTVMDATFSRNHHLTFAQRFMYERGMLALEDPEGEDPDRPVNVDVLLGMPKADEQTALRASMDKLMREAALAGDWQLWERIKVERWPNGYGKE